MKNDEDKEEITNLVVNTVFIFDLQKSNNCNNVGFGMQKSTDDMLGISSKSIVVFPRSLGVFA